MREKSPRQYPPPAKRRAATIPSQPTFLGTVLDVRGPTVSVKLDPDTVSGLAFVDGHGYRIGQVGSFVRIPIGYTDLFGVVSQVGAGAVPERLAALEPHGHRWLTIQLIGEGHRRGDFRRGVSQYPTVGDLVHLVTEADLARIYGRPESPTRVRIGHLASAESIPALLDINKLITRHSAILGTTGTGKSTTVAGPIASLADADRYPSARIIVLDIHGEYSAALSDVATVLSANASASTAEKPLYIPYWALTFDELLPLTLGHLEDDGRAAVLERVASLKMSALGTHPRDGVTEDTLTVDTPVPFSIHQLWFDLHCEMHATHYETPGESQSAKTWALDLDGNKNPVEPGNVLKVIPPRFRAAKDVKADPEKIRLSSSTLNIRRAVDSLASKLRDPRFDFLFRPGPCCPDTSGQPLSDLDWILEEWVGGSNSVTIFDLSGIPPSVVADLIGALLRLIYDALFWSRHLSEGGRERPLLVVLEEAHTYLGQDNMGAAALAVRRIVKEGRKYGIGAMIVSQRPAEIDSTILSQCGTIIAMRLANATDRAHVTSAVTDNLEGLLSMLPVLRTGEAIVVGEAVHLPVRTLLDPPSKNRRPDSSDPLVFNDMGPGGWNRSREPADYKDVVAVWRKQNPRSPRAQTDPSQ